MNYYYNRGKCEFGNCQCQNHILRPNTEKCLICNHGTCWHKKININISQFYSTRNTAMEGKYIVNIIRNKCSDLTRYCDKIENLPV